MAVDRDDARFARAVAGAVGAVFLLVGILGFIPGVTTDYDNLKFAENESTAELLGIFQVSILHNIVHVLFGLAGLAAAREVRYVVPYLFGGAAIYALLTIYGVLIDKDAGANFVPVNSADNWLHLGLAAGMVLLGVLVQQRLSDRRTGRAT